VCIKERTVEYGIASLPLT